MSSPLSQEEQQLLLKLARTSIESRVFGKRQPKIDFEEVSHRLQQDGATFVTLMENGELRGCIGTLEAYQPLVQDVCEHAVAAAVDDYRFMPVRPEEVEKLHIEISVLSQPEPLAYDTPEELLHLLRPNIDGVLIRDGKMRATFLPQVWEQIPDPDEFLSHLCRKMGAPAQLWKNKKLQVFTYQVEMFEEK